MDFSSEMLKWVYKNQGDELDSIIMNLPTCPFIIKCLDIPKILFHESEEKISTFKLIKLYLAMTWILKMELAQRDCEVEVLNKEISEKLTVLFSHLPENEEEERLFTTYYIRIHEEFILKMIYLKDNDSMDGFQDYDYNALNFVSKDDTLLKRQQEYQDLDEEITRNSAAKRIQQWFHKMNLKKLIFEVN